MRLRVVGAAPAGGNPGEAQSGYLVSLAGGTVLLDCGNGVVARLLEAGVAPDHIVLSHLHLDHSGDLLTAVFAAFDDPARTRPVVWLPPGGRFVMDELLRTLGFRLALMEEVLTVREYRTAAALEIAGARLTFARTSHSAHSYLMRVEADGRALVYTGDTAPVAQLVTFAAGCDLLLCEATLADPAEDLHHRVHLTAHEAAAVAAAADVGRLVLTHLPARRREAAVAEAATAFPAVTAALPDDELDV